MSKKKIAGIVVLVVILVIAVAVVSFLYGAKQASESSDSTIDKEDVITAVDLEEAIDVSQLSTAEFIYNGIAEKYSEDDSDEVDCYIAYNATVKVGIDMEDVSFEIDDEAMTVTAILPEIEINIATIDEDSLSYIPSNPDVDLSEVISLCKEDAITEANSSETLYETAEDNLKSVIEALLSPLLTSADYTLVWESEE